VIDVWRHHIAEHAINAGPCSDSVDGLIEIEAIELDAEKVNPRTSARRAIVSHCP